MKKNSYDKISNNRDSLKMQYSDENLYTEIIMSYLDTESVKRTAENLKVSPVRVRKVLITEQLWSSKKSLEIEHYLNLGKTTAEIAQLLSTTEKAVQQYLPYTRGLYGENKSVNAINSANYRERIRIVQDHTLRKRLDTAVKEGWEEMYDMNILNQDKDIMPKENEIYFEQYPGMICMREVKDFDHSKAKCQGVDLYRLHIELHRDDPFAIGEISEEALEAYEQGERDEMIRVLQAYGNVQGKTISRDIIVPGDMELYALHYVIQRLFGWQNYHLHNFQLPEETFRKITENSVGKWSELVGVLFQSPLLDDQDRYWADDYDNGSFKRWLKKKYTGPTISLNHGEGIIQSKLDVAEMKKWAKFIQIAYAQGNCNKEYIYMANIARTARPENLTQKDKDFGIVRKEVVPFDQAPLGTMFHLFESAPNHLLERLRIEDVLAFHQKGIADALAEEDEICDSYDVFMDEDLIHMIQNIVNSGIDEPLRQPIIGQVTDTLFYEYDYGDGWKLKITGSLDAVDLVEAGVVTDEEIDEAVRTVLMKYRPVCIAADGLPLLEDVGGIDGYLRFLRGINGDHSEDNWDYDDVQESLEWAKSQGWSKRKIKPENML